MRLLDRVHGWVALVAHFGCAESCPMDNVVFMACWSVDVEVVSRSYLIGGSYR